MQTCKTREYKSYKHVQNKRCDSLDIKTLLYNA